MATSIHSFRVPAIDGGVVDFSQFAGKKILLVNVASFCGLTPQYQQLEDLYKNYSDKIVVVGCPANNFGSQEPHDNATIQQFCTTEFGVTFPLTAKISVAGDDIHPLYQYVTQSDLNGRADSGVAWNFQKYVFDEDGLLTHFFSPNIDPADDAILDALGILPAQHD